MPQDVPVGFERLLASFDWFNVEDWWNRWVPHGGVTLARHHWSAPVVDG